ncbi:Serine protease 7 [Amphibalanus amphitrite]|uniref:Serine protease 7 n=1 Tax=Amphibalanus amphitrite TaxID=1232801 RepID=A0A6A4VXF3_AMPAM|nr:Serine protease 7 [Amphibalanus amphitrite]
MVRAVTLLVCCALVAAAAGADQVPCTVDEAGTGGVCGSLSDCPELERLARSARPNTPAVQRLRSLVAKCSQLASGRIQICCQNEETRTAQPPAPRVQLPVPPTCGPRLFSKVVGGDVAVIGEFPWMVSIQYTKTRPDSGLQHGCGGTLITSRHVLTAAHCVSFLSTPESNELTPVAVVLGELDFDSEIDCLSFGPTTSTCADRPITVDIEAIFPHPDFQNIRQLALPNDIAVVRLAREMGTIVGWWRTNVSSFSPVVQRARLPIVNISHCERRFRRSLPSRLCVGERPSDIRTCPRDPGGPLLVTNRFDTFFQTGIFSFPSVCGMRLAVYTRVFDYIDWIIEQINK